MISQMLGQAPTQHPNPLTHQQSSLQAQQQYAHAQGLGGLIVLDWKGKMQVEVDNYLKGWDK